MGGTTIAQLVWFAHVIGVNRLSFPQDTMNVNGGKWIVRLKKGLASRYWESLVNWVSVSHKQVQSLDPIINLIYYTYHFRLWLSLAISLMLVKRYVVLFCPFAIQKIFFLFGIKVHMRVEPIWRSGTVLLSKFVINAGELNEPFIIGILWRRSWTYQQIPSWNTKPTMIL